MSDKTTRRMFLGASAAILGAAPSDTINLGMIGCGARGKGVHIPGFLKLPGTRFTAVCDVNSKYLAEGRMKAGGEKVAAYKDFRKLLEDKNVDAVIIGTNQQWHVLQMIAACQAGKDVYLEKPLGNSIGEGPVAIEAARKYGRIIQVGTQQRSQAHYRQAIEIVRSGKLGQISEVKVWDYENMYPGTGSPADCTPPEELDWDFYVGPSPFRTYNPNMYYKYGYDWFKIAGAGHQVAWGVHHFDIVLAAMGVNSPQSVYATGGNYAFQDNHDYPNTFSATATFGPGPVSKIGFALQYTMRAGSKREKRSHGKCFFGTEASMILDRAGYSIMNEVRGQQVQVEETVEAKDDHLYHFELFLNNIREHKLPEANPETCHYATAVGHLMNISWEVGRSINWDGKSNRILHDRQADALVMRPYRAPWKLKV